MMMLKDCTFVLIIAAWIRLRSPRAASPRPRRGFSLIEVVIAVAVSSFLSIMVFQAVSLFQRSALRYHEMAQYVRQQELWYRELEKDLSATVIPLSGFTKEVKKEVPQKDAQGVAPQKQEKASEKGDDFQKKNQEYAQKFSLHCTIENGANGESLCRNITWVTTNVLRVYGQQKPLLVRVRYYVQPDPEYPGLYTLYRQELPILDMKEIEKVSIEPQHAGIPIAFHIKQLRVGFTSIERKGKELAVKELNVWTSKQKESKETKEPKEAEVKEIPLPQMMSFSGTMVHPATQHEYPYEFHIPLVVVPLGKSDEKNN